MIETPPSCRDDHEPGLIPLHEALARVLAAVPQIAGRERIGIESARGRTLAETVTARFDVPGHTNSAVDGYALHGDDLPAAGIRELAIAGRVLAGESAREPVGRGQCVKIMTGAPIPHGLDTVIMQEHAEELGATIRIDARHKPGQNVRKAGEDMAQGQAVLRPGRWLTPPDIGLLAALGIAEIDVARKLRVAIASTGNELHGIGSFPGAAGIFDSNRYALLAALDRPDIETADIGILQDRPEALLASFEQAAAFADVLVSSGGVSAGEADFTKTALESAGCIDFWKVAVKPGRPLAFGRVGNAVFFGLPGNPVAVMTSFYLLVLPAIEKMLGIGDKPIAPTLRARTLERFRKKPGRTEVQRGIIQQAPNGDWTVVSTGDQGSGILSSLAKANAFIILEHERGTVEPGEWVWVRPFAGLF